MDIMMIFLGLGFPLVIVLCIILSISSKKEEEEKEKTFIDLHWQSYVNTITIRRYCSKQNFPYEIFKKELLNSPHCIYINELWVWIGTEQGKQEYDTKEEEKNRQKRKEIQEKVLKSLDKSEKI
jgi:hypothetical protein